MPDASNLTPPLTPLQRTSTNTNGSSQSAEQTQPDSSTAISPTTSQKTFLCGNDLTKATADGQDVEIVRVIEDGTVTDWNALTALWLVVCRSGCLYFEAGFALPFCPEPLKVSGGNLGRTRVRWEGHIQHNWWNDGGHAGRN